MNAEMIADFNQTMMGLYLWALVNKAVHHKHDAFIGVIRKRYNRELVRYKLGM